MRTLDTSIIECNQQKIEFFISGNSGLAIVFVNGFRMELSNWSRVIDDLSKKDSEVKLVSYNRCGAGKSSQATSNQHGSAVINDMKSILESIGIAGPTIMVAHSLGGIFANLYTRQFPENVKGLIFVDAPHTEEILEQKNQGVPFF